MRVVFIYMTITERQENILNTLIQEYINAAKPVSSELLGKKHGFGFSPATIRNEMKKLTESGYLEQPHTSAGRVPTEKAYRYFVDELFQKQEQKEKLFSDFILKEIETAKQIIEEELALTRVLENSLAEMSSVLNFTYLPEKDVLYDILAILGTSKTTYEKNVGLINSIIKGIKGLEEF